MHTEKRTYSHPEELHGIYQAIYTLFQSPKHRDKLHVLASDYMRYHQQPLQPPIEHIVEELYTKISKKVNPVKQKKLNERELMQRGGLLMQFTDYAPILRSFIQLSYRQIESLYNDVIYETKTIGQPLAFTEQLSVALSQTEGDLPEALWRLFFTSRLHARWFDSTAIPDLPVLTDEEKLHRMIRWQQSLAACKTGSLERVQDVGGDTYYTWTHALASVVYEILPAHISWKTHCAAKIFQNGTYLMQRIVHGVHSQRVPSDHSKAADYGNAIGKVCVQLLAQ